MRTQNYNPAISFSTLRARSFAGYARRGMYNRSTSRPRCLNLPVINHQPAEADTEGQLSSEGEDEEVCSKGSKVRLKAKLVPNTSVSSLSLEPLSPFNLPGEPTSA